MLPLCLLGLSCAEGVDEGPPVAPPLPPQEAGQPQPPLLPPEQQTEPPQGMGGEGVPPEELPPEELPPEELPPEEMPPEEVPPEEVPPEEMPPPPPEGECDVPADCGPNRLCVNHTCVDDPAVPSPIGDGACSREADEARGMNLQGIAFTCGLSCSGDVACIADCVAQNSGLSAGCARCYGDLIACSGSICLIACFGGSNDCDDCRDQACNPAFEACAGLRAPVSW